MRPTKSTRPVLILYGAILVVHAATIGGDRNEHLVCKTVQIITNAALREYGLPVKPKLPPLPAASLAFMRCLRLGAVAQKLEARVPIVGQRGLQQKNGLTTACLASIAGVRVDGRIRTKLLKRARREDVIDQNEEIVRPSTPAEKTGQPDIPRQIGPCQFGRFGGWVTVRCPRDYAPLMRLAGGMWDPGARQWCIVPRRIGPVLQEVLRTARAAASAGTNCDTLSGPEIVGHGRV